jgi:hypothetical protein
VPLVTSHGDIRGENGRRCKQGVRDETKWWRADSPAGDVT